MVLSKADHFKHLLFTRKRIEKEKEIPLKSLKFNLILFSDAFFTYFLFVLTSNFFMA